LLLSELTKVLLLLALLLGEALHLLLLLLLLGAPHLLLLPRCRCSSRRVCAAVAAAEEPCKPGVVDATTLLVLFARRCKASFY